MCTVSFFRSLASLSSCLATQTVKEGLICCPRTFNQDDIGLFTAALFGNSVTPTLQSWLNHKPFRGTWNSSALSALEHVQIWRCIYPHLDLVDTISCVIVSVRFLDVHVRILLMSMRSFSFVCSFCPVHCCSIASIVFCKFNDRFIASIFEETLIS